MSNQFKLARELYNPAVVGMGGPSVDMLDAAVEKAAERPAAERAAAERAAAASVRNRMASPNIQPMER